ncbi:MAG: flagellar protein FlgN [Bacillota bacterium]|nr:flagellar protein FlgN [Bacillota bacterium]
MGNADLSKLIRYSEEKLDKLKEIKQLTRMQKDAIGNEDIDALNNLVEEKQKIIDYISWCDQSFQTELANLRELMSARGSMELKDVLEGNPDNEALRSAIRQIVNTVEDIQEMEKENHLRLLNNMEEIKDRLKKIRQGKKGLNGYNQNVSGVSGSFIDKMK